MASTNFINECKNGANGNRLGKIIIDGVSTPLTESNKIASFSVDSGCYVDGTVIGTVYIKCLNGQLVNIDSIEDLIDKEITASVGVKFANSSTEYVDLGKYTISRPNDAQTLKECQITAYDNIYNKINEKYVCGLDYTTPKTVGNVYQDLCTNLGLTPVTTTFLNSTIPVVNNPFQNGETNLIVLQSIAKVACSFVTIDETNDHIDLSWLSTNDTPDYTFQLSDYSTLEGGTIEYGPLNVITIRNSQIETENVTRRDETSIAQYGEHQISISEDYFLYSEALREQAITAIYNRLDNLKYVDTKLTCLYGKPFLKIGDKIRIYKDSENYIDTYVLIHKFTYDGAFTSVIESPALTGQETATQIKTTLSKAVRRTEIIVDKQQQEITAVVSRTDVIEQNLDPENELTSSNNTYHIEDAMQNGLIKLTMDGKSEQETRSGKNLLNNTLTTQTISGITLTKNNDGTFTINGTANAQIIISISNTQNIQDIVGLNQRVILSGITTPGNYELRWSESNIVYTDSGSGIEFLPSSNAIGTYIIIRSGASFNNIIVKPMIRLATITDPTYEPYGISPSPDYPSEIKSVGYENLFNLDYGYYNSNVIKDSDGITYKAWVHNFINNTNLIKMLQPNTTYTVSFEAQLIDLVQYSETQKLMILYKSGSPLIYMSNFSINDLLDNQIHKSTYTFTTPSDLTGYAILIYSSYMSGTSNYSTIKISNLSIEQGTISHQYIPYGKYGIEYKTVGNNLLNKEDYTQITTGNNDGATNVKTANKITITTGSGTNSGIYITKTNLISYIDNYNSEATYNVSMDIKTNRNITLSIGCDTRPNFSVSATTSRINVNTKISSNGLVIYSTMSNAGDTIEVTNIMISTTGGEYEPYQEQTYLITLDQPLRRIGNIKDKLRVENGMLFVDRNIRHAELAIADMNNSQNYPGWHDTPETQQMYKDYPNKNTGMTNIAPWQCNVLASSKSPGINTTGSAGVIYIPRGNYDYSETQWKSLYPNLVFKLDYVMPSTETEELGSIDIPMLENINNIDIFSNINTDSYINYSRNVAIANYVASSIKLTTDSIEAQVEDNTNGLNSANFTINAQGATLDVISTNIDKENGDINSVTTKEKKFTFNDNGLTITNSASGYKRVADEEGDRYYDGTAEVAEYTKDGSKQKDLSLFGTYKYGMTNFNDTPRFAGQLYTATIRGNSRTGFGHFKNS